MSFQPAIPFISPVMFRTVWKRYYRHACSIRLARRAMITWRSTNSLARTTRGNCSSVSCTEVAACARARRRLCPFIAAADLFVAGGCCDKLNNCSMAHFLWTQKQDIGPVGRRDVAMAFDTARGRAVLFGGQTGSKIIDDTWEWDG